jgi:hypothetical protein
MNAQLLVIGKPHSAKSTFLIQLYSKIIGNKTALRLYKPITNISALTDGRKRLANGLEPITTPAEENSEIIFPLQIGHEHVDLNCLDYGGEQINSIITSRQLDKRWITSINKSYNWILFIRLSNLDFGPDISNKTISKDQLKQKPLDTSNIFTLSDQSSYIELLQIFLNAKDHNAHIPNPLLKLAVVMTCWDELKSKKTPRETLSDHLPLLLSFIETNWKSGNVKFLGLSPQGFSLSEEKNKTLFKEDGPENFGFLIRPDGKKTEDISELIALALQ